MSFRTFADVSKNPIKEKSQYNIIVEDTIITKKSIIHSINISTSFRYHLANRHTEHGMLIYW
jgi:hypothetical protein